MRRHHRGFVDPGGADPRAAFAASIVCCNAPASARRRRPAAVQRTGMPLPGETIDVMGDMVLAHRAVVGYPGEWTRPGRKASIRDADSRSPKVAFGNRRRAHSAPAHPGAWIRRARNIGLPEPMGHPPIACATERTRQSPKPAAARCRRRGVDAEIDEKPAGACEGSGPFSPLASVIEAVVEDSRSSRRRWRTRNSGDVEAGDIFRQDVDRARTDRDHRFVSRELCFRRSASP